MAKNRLHLSLKATITCLIITILPPIDAISASDISYGYELANAKAVTQDDGQTITGKVVDTKGIPIAGVNILVSNVKGLGTTTDTNGAFTLNNVPMGSRLTFSFLGFLDKSISVTDGKENYVIVLEEDNENLNEAVVVGYGTQKKVNLTGSVSSVNFDKIEFQSRPLTNTSTALSGLTPGLRVTQNQGTPSNDGASLTLRGVGTLNSGSSPLVLIDGQPGDINLVSPADISNISILKDAASAAIYGSRAANGVILITTKSGSNTDGKIQISYNGSIGISKPTKLYDIISNTADHMSLVNRILTNSGRATYYSDEWIEEWREKSKTDPILYPNTDWWDVIIKDNTIQNHSISARGSKNKINFYTSVNYLGNDGLIKNTWLNRINFRNNLSYQVNSWLKLGHTLSGTFKKYGPASTDGIFQWFYATSPGVLPKSPDGRYGGAMTGHETASNNILQTIETSVGSHKEQNYNGKIYVSITPIENLEIYGSFYFMKGYSDSWSSSRPASTWDFQNETIIRAASSKISISRSSNQNRREVVDLYAKYGKSIKDHYFSILVGYNQEYYKSSSFSANKTDLISLDTPVLNAAATVQNANGTMDDYAMQSVFGRINYNYREKYLFEANLRADGSSRFSSDNRWGYFPSVSAGWLISEESFWENLKQDVNSLKLRVSYGRLGNNGIGNHEWQSVYSPYNYSLGGVIVTGLGQQAIANSDITWEKTDVLNLGIDLSLFNRLTLSAEYYNKFTHGILATLPIPYVNGGLTSPRVNSAKVRNKGVEFDLQYKDMIGPLGIQVGFNGSFNKNEIVRYKGDLLEIHGVSVWTEGQPLNKFYIREVDHIVQDQSEIDKLIADGYQFKPSVPGPGDFLYKDKNGDKSIDDNDRTLLGNPYPKFIYGGNISLDYKGFDLYILMTGVAGLDKYLSSQFFSTNQYVQGYLYPKKFLKSWTTENKSNKIPKIYVSNSKNQQVSDYFLKSADFMRIKTIQLGYTIPQKITEKISIDKLRLYVNLENFFTFTSYPGMDPETSGSRYNSDTTYPLMKTTSFGVNINF